MLNNILVCEGFLFRAEDFFKELKNFSASLNDVWSGVQEFSWVVMYFYGA